MLNFFLIQRQPPQQFSVSCHTAGAWLVWYWKRKCHLQNNQFCFFIGGKRVSTPCPASCGEESHLTVYSSCQTHQALFPTRRKKPVDCSICCLQESLHWPQLQRNSEFFFFYSEFYRWEEPESQWPWRPVRKRRVGRRSQVPRLLQPPLLPNPPLLKTYAIYLLYHPQNLSPGTYLFKKSV